MRSRAYLGSVAAGMTAVALSSAVACVGRASAGDAAPAAPAPYARPATQQPARPPAQPQSDGRDIHLDENDEIAALEAIRVALTEVADGSSYVWHRRHGQLSGLVQPTASFKDPSGKVCRHIILILTAGLRTGRAEGIACRLANGRWQLDG
jgi:surface antigen